MEQKQYPQECFFYNEDGKCQNYRVPKRFGLFTPLCILVKNHDVRIEPKCVLYYTSFDKDGKPNPPPSRVIKEDCYVGRKL